MPYLLGSRDVPERSEEHLSIQVRREESGLRRRDDLSEEAGDTALVETMLGGDLTVTYIAQGRNFLAVGAKVPRMP